MTVQILVKPERQQRVSKQPVTFADANAGKFFISDAVEQHCERRTVFLFAFRKLLRWKPGGQIAINKDIFGQNSVTHARKQGLRCLDLLLDTHFLIVPKFSACSRVNRGEFSPGFSHCRLLYRSPLKRRESRSTRTPIRMSLRT